MNTAWAGQIQESIVVLKDSGAYGPVIVGAVVTGLIGLFGVWFRRKR